VHNSAVWQCPLELLDTFVGNFGSDEVQETEVRQSFQVFQPGIGDLGSGEM